MREVTIVNPPKIPPVDAKKVRSILEKYSCPVPYHEVRTRFLGNIATPEMVASPMSVVASLWGGELPGFEDMDAVNELLDVLVNELWNNLTRHQKRTDPFHLIRMPMDPTLAGLAAYALVRCEEIDGFVEGMFCGQDVVDLPEKAYASMDVLSELHALLSGAHALAMGDATLVSDNELAATLTQVQQLTPIIEKQINSVVLSCTRARRQMHKSPDFSGPTVH